ncbi:MAG: DUF2034 domain-containing protein, partial [Thaumarchaeota archaeon]|nr:DUF2034 domain-containing protein [Nitrososphaerota archaeon]
TWAVPSSAQPLRILLQCKAGGAQKVGPHLIRELEGAFAGAPVGWREQAGVVGFLVAEKPATKGIRDSLGRSRYPMGFVTCSSGGAVSQMLWNRRAEEEGLAGMGVGLRHGSDGNSQVVLTWEGKHLPLLASAHGSLSTKDET